MYLASSKPAAVGAPPGKPKFLKEKERKKVKVKEMSRTERVLTL